MKKMNQVLILAFALLSVACVKKVDGNFTANETLRLKTKRGVKVVSPGQKVATLKLKTKKKIQLVFNNNGKKTKVNFKVPSGVNIPRDFGRLRLSADEIGQSYDLDASVDSRTTSSEPRYGTETCYRTVTRPVRRCRTVNDGYRRECRYENGRRVCRNVPNRRRVCHTVWESVRLSGFRDITYVINSVVKEFSLNLINPENQRLSAQFKGSKYSSHRNVVDRAPYCQITGYDLITGRYIDRL